MILSSSLMVLAVLILVCVCATKVSSRINLPVLVMFLAVGMLAGEQGIGRINFEWPVLANIVGSIAMAFILFSGGFDTSWKNVKGVFLYGSLLSSIGVLLTAFFAGSITFLIMKTTQQYNVHPFSWYFLLGAIISSTDAAAVFSILRSRKVSLAGDLRPLLEYESGSNDPMAAFLTIFLIPIAEADTGSGHNSEFLIYLPILYQFLIKMSIGIFCGIIIGKLSAWLFNHLDLEYDGLYYVIGIATVLLAYGMTELCQGNGFMAVYIAGMVMGNTKFIYHNSMGRFLDGSAWFMQVILFTMLGLLVTPSIVWEARYMGLGIALILMFIARPLAVFLCTIGSKYSIREKLLVSWVGLRGGAPIMLATLPWSGNVIGNKMMFHIVFFIVLLSVILQGTTLMPFARLLKLDKPLKVHPRVPLEFENTGNMNGETKEYELLPGSSYEGKTLAELGLPGGALVLLIRRRGTFLIPHGNTKLMANDALMVLGTPEILQKTNAMFGITEE